MARIAFIGMGVMGYPMAGHLKKKGGHEVTVYNRTAAKALNWAKEWRQRPCAERGDAVMTAAYRPRSLPFNDSMARAPF